MMKRAGELIVNELAKTKIRFSVQVYLTEFYQNLVFKKVSGECLDGGIVHFQFLYEI